MLKVDSKFFKYRHFNILKALPQLKLHVFASSWTVKKFSSHKSKKINHDIKVKTTIQGRFEGDSPFTDDFTGSAQYLKPSSLWQFKLCINLYACMQNVVPVQTCKLAKSRKLQPNRMKHLNNTFCNIMRFCLQMTIIRKHL